MSTGLECCLVEWKPGEWYYVLEQGTAPKEAWDWREYADAFGPYPSMEKANEGLRDNHANPGGYSIKEYSPKLEKDEVLAGLITKATKRLRVDRPFTWNWAMDNWRGL